MQEPSFTNFQAYFGSRRPFLWSVNWLFCRPCRPRNSDAFWGTVQVFEIPKDDRKIIKRQRLGQLGVASQLLKLLQIWWWSLPDLEELCSSTENWRCTSLCASIWIPNVDLLRLPISPKDIRGKKKIIWSSGSSEFDLSETFHIWCRHRSRHLPHLTDHGSHQVH